MARAGAVGKRDVMHAAVAVHLRGPHAGRLLMNRILCDAEPHVAAKCGGLLHVRADQVEVVDAQRLQAPIAFVVLGTGLKAVHCGRELERYTQRTTGAQDTAIERAIYPFGRQITRLEPRLRLFQRALVPEVEAQHADLVTRTFA